MAVMTTVLTEFSDNGNSRTYVRAGHTALMPKLVIQKRKVPGAGKTTQEDSLAVITATYEADGVTPASSRVVFEVTVRRPNFADAAHITDSLAVIRDIVASDEFTSMVNESLFVK